MSRLERLYSPPEIGAPGKREAGRRHRDLFLSGLFVLAMAAVAIAAFALLIPGLFGGAYRLVVDFHDATGLNQGIQVLQEGYVIGIVEAVTPVFPGRSPKEPPCPPPPADTKARAGTLPCFRATLRIKDRWPVPKGSQAQLGAAGLLAGDAIIIHPGSGPALLADGDPISALGRAADPLAKINQLADSLDAIVQETVAPALNSIAAQIKTIEGLLGTGTDQAQNRERLAGALDSLRALAANLEASLDRKTMDSIVGSIQSATRQIEGAVGTTQALLNEVHGLVRDNRPGLQRALDDTQNLLAEITADLTPILVNFEDLSRNLSAFSRDLRQDPAVILKGRKAQEQAPWFK